MRGYPGSVIYISAAPQGLLARKPLGFVGLSWSGLFMDGGDPDMRFSDDFRNSVGFILNGEEPWGTFFLIRFRMSPAEATHGGADFMVTARHCIEGNPDPQVRYRGALPARTTQRLNRAPQWPVHKWHFPEDEDVDLAVAVFDPPVRVTAKIVPAEFATAHVGRRIELGELAYFVGLWDISARQNRGAVPLVRSASIAAFNEPDIKRVDPESGLQVGVWPNVHLVDVRSRGGFSGGPCFVQRLVSRAWRNSDLPLPEPWLTRAQNAGTDIQSLGEVATFTDWWGMFVGFAEMDGIGAVLPVEEILTFFESEKMMEVIAP